MLAPECLEAVRFSHKVLHAMLRKLSHKSDGRTGHISVEVQIVEVNGNLTIEGPAETHGIHPQQLKEGYNGDVTEWLRGVHRTMKQQHEDRKVARGAVEALNGIIHLDDEE